MFEKVNPSHPDKLADRIAGAIVDLAYKKVADPKIAVEVLLGHGVCHIITETSEELNRRDVQHIVNRIAGNVKIIYDEHKQDSHLAENQSEKIRCGDNGIFKGTPVTDEQKKLTNIAQSIYKTYREDGKYILQAETLTEREKLIICQSNAKTEDIKRVYKNAIVNPLGDWTGGTDVDTGATNRKLGSDMGDSVTGGGLHGKDLSKADVSVNIYAFLMAQKLHKEVKYFCAIGDEEVNGVPYEEIVRIAREYIKEIGGFEKLAEWGLIR